MISDTMVSGMASSSPKTQPMLYKEFDKLGDLILMVGTAPAEFKVCSRAMARASIVFDKMLYGQWAESKHHRRIDEHHEGQDHESGNGEDGFGRWTVELPDEDPETFSFILSRIHDDDEKVPNYPDFDTLHMLVIQIDKCDLFHLFARFVGKWTTALNDYAYDFGLRAARLDVGRCDSTVLTIAWLLGQYKLLDVALNHITKNAKLDAEDHLVRQHGSMIEFFHSLGEADLLRNKSIL